MNRPNACTLFGLSLGLIVASILDQGKSIVAADPDTRVFEMRIYFAAEGKLESLNTRFRDHTTKLFEKHGISNIGYWEPIDNKERQLIYFLAYPTREAREQSWKAFSADPDWQKAKNASEVNGKLVAKVESKFFQATDYSPAIKANAEGGRVFELRTYTAAPGKLDALNARFRDHTVKLFEKHGMKNVAYWNLVKGEEGSDSNLTYIISHKSEEDAKASFKAFGNDQAWKDARAASEANGALTVRGGVQSLFMKATDYSPIR